MDDVIVFGSNQEEHDTHLMATLECLDAAGVTLNPLKYEFRKQAMKFLGHVVSADGISADSDKTSAIHAMPRHGDGESDGQILPKHGRTEPAIERATEL